MMVRLSASLGLLVLISHNSNDFLTLSGSPDQAKPGLLHVLDKLAQNSNCSRLVEVLPLQYLLCQALSSSSVVMIITTTTTTTTTSVTKDESLQHLH